MSVVQLLRYRNLKYRLQYLAEYVSMYFMTGEITPYYVKERDGKEPVVHFAVAVFGGFLLCIWEKGGNV
jgi:prepilin peptidase CpaA